MQGLAMVSVLVSSDVVFCHVFAEMSMAPMKTSVSSSFFFFGMLAITSLVQMTGTGEPRFTFDVYT